MVNSNLVQKSKSREDFEDQLSLVLKQGAQRMLTKAVEAEVEAFLASHSSERNATGLKRLARDTAPQPPARVL